ncbi:MAG: hypothetical protein ACUVUR_06165 [bacterium]
MTSITGKGAVLSALFFSSIWGGWLPIDSITNRNLVDVTCNNNARAVVSDPAGNIHIVWRGKAPSLRQVWYSFWDAHNREWSEDTVISDGRNDVGDPAIACDSSGNLYVAYISAGVLWLKRRDRLTGAWLPADSLIGHVNDSAVSIAIDRNGVQHLVWTRAVIGDNRIYHVSHNDSAWGRVDTVTEMIRLDNTRASVASTTAGDLMVVWHELGDPFNVVLSRRRIAGVWAATETVYNRRGGAWPCVCWSPDSFYVLWVAIGSGTDRSIMYRARGAGGWGDTVKLSSDRSPKTDPSITTDPAGNLFASWAGFDSLQPTSSQIYYSYRARGGQWLRQDTLTSEPGNRLRVSVSAGLGTLQVAWTEKRLLTDSFTVRLRRYERIHDVGVLRIEQPPPEIDSGTTFNPLAVIANFGRTAEANVMVRFSIDDIRSRRVIPRLEPYTHLPVGFDSFTASVSGWHFFSCSTSVAQDEEASNDTIGGRFFVRVRDVVMDRIISPIGRIVEETIVPEAKIYNRGNVPVQCRCWIRIYRDTWERFSDSKPVTLNAGDTIRVAFSAWQTEVGRFQVRCSTTFPGDMHPQNDTASREFWVVKRDAGVLRIIWPVDTVDSGMIGEPGAVVKNYGDESESISVILNIGTGYSQRKTVQVNAGDSLVVNFSPWQAAPRGVYSVSCSTMLAGDRHRENNLMLDSVFVRVLDAGVVAIVRPGELNSRGELTIQSRVKNYGNCLITLPVNFQIQDSNGNQVYFDSVLIGRMPPASDSLITFSSWQAQKCGGFTARCVTALNGDMVPENDSAAKYLRVARWDVAAREIISPADTVVEGVVEPIVSVVNLSEEPVRFYGYLSIFSLPDSNLKYLDSMSIVLDTAEIKNITFRQWQAMPGAYLIVCQTHLLGDENPANDTTDTVFYVESLSTRRWRELISIPAGARNRPVRSGGSLVSTEAEIYALKGGGTAEWFKYQPGSASWVELSPLPTGQSGRRPKGGATLCWNRENQIFALKGKNTREFWLYSCASDSWVALSGLPEYTRGVRYGSGLAFVAGQNGDKVFCLKGSGTNDFLVYWVKTDEWHARRPVPGGVQNKPVKKGSALVALKNRVYCLKGATNEFYEYLPDQDTWQNRSGLPLGDERRFRRCREGAALACDNSRFIYAFKGGRSNEFWRYDADLDSWEKLEEIPLGNHWRRVGPGGALAFLSGRVYALKGGGCREFWCYEPIVKGSDWTEAKGADLVFHSSAGQGISPAPDHFNTDSTPPHRSTVTAADQARVKELVPVIIYDASGRIRNDAVLKSGVYFTVQKNRPLRSGAKKIVVLKRQFKPVR